MVTNQVERLKKDLRSLETFEHKMIAQDRIDCIRGIRLKKQYLIEHIEQLKNVA